MFLHHLALVARLRESLATLPNDLVNLIQLAILWRATTSPVMTLHHPINQAARLGERYQYHLAERFDQAHISPTVMDLLFSPASGPSQ